jgi:phage terminase large subunit
MVAPGSRRGFALHGDNAKAYNSREPEVLLAGAAGTGKSLAWLAKVLTLCGKYPGARCLVCRKTRESLTDSILVTWERDVLGPDHPVLTKSPTLRRVRQSYRFPNGSEVVVGGMDKPDKVLSSEWDLIYCPEATDLDLVDWETLGGRLRAGRVPFQQLAGDCNPTTPHHFLYKRQAQGLTRLYTSRHEDNPRYFDRARGEWTAAGAQYLARLERMTGARRDRFLKGLWVAAEGVVYDYVAAAPPEGHLLPADFRAPPEWPRVWSIDWGMTAPTSLGVWAVDPDCRMYRTREVYKTRLRPDVLGRRAREWIDSGEEPAPRAIVCDHDEERKADFEKASGLALELADKRDRDKGIEATQARFDRADDGRARIFFREGAREHPADRFLVDAGRPASCLEELVGYAWDPDFLADEPVAENDHAMDEMRYACRWVAANLAGWADPYAPEPVDPLLPAYYGTVR